MPVKPPRQRLPPLNQLRAFEAAARHGSFTRAADELGVTPGAVTQQIRQFEAWLGFPLFRRLPQGVALTEAARAALPRLSRGFEALGDGVEALRSGHGNRALTIAALPCLAQLWLSPRLAGLRAVFPKLQISVSAMEEPPDPRREPHDLALFYEAWDGEGQDAILPVCAPALASKLSTLDDLSCQTLLHDAVWRQDWQRWLGFVGAPDAIDPRRGPSFSLYSLVLDAALSGSGVLMGRRSLIASHLADGRLVAPFGRAMPTGDRVALTSARERDLHLGCVDVINWLEK